MIITVTGGSGSGKSALGEAIALRLQPGKKYYIATMETSGEEAACRIRRHRQMRAGKQFITVECPVNLAAVKIPAHATVLLECISNLAANELFSPQGCGLEQAERKIITALEQLAATCTHLVIITNEIFSDGLPYEKATLPYIRLMGRLNQYLGRRSQIYLESVYSLPLVYKGELPWPF